MSPNDRHDNPAGQDEAFVPLQRRQRYQDFIRECHACQQEIEPDWQACAHCGTRLGTECPGCGNPLPPAGAKLCPSCGLPLPQQAGS